MSERKIPPPSDEDMAIDLADAYRHSVAEDWEVSEGNAQAAIRRALAAEFALLGANKAIALLHAGMESQSELMHGLKQQARAAEARVRELEAEAEKYRDLYNLAGQVVRDMDEERGR